MTNPGSGGLAPFVIACVSVSCALIIIHRQRFPAVEHFFFLMAYTLPVVVGMGIRCGEELAGGAVYGDAWGQC